MREADVSSALNGRITTHRLSRGAIEDTKDLVRSGKGGVSPDKFVFSTKGRFAKDSRVLQACPSKNREPCFSLNIHVDETSFMSDVIPPGGGSLS